MDSIVVKEITKKYNERIVVNKLSLEVKPAKIVGLLGPNGAGKTTSFYMVSGLIQPDSGEVYLGEQKISRLKMYQRARLGIGYLPQENSVFRRLSVRENIELVLQSKGLDNLAIKAKTDELLHALGLEKIQKSKANTVSGGERRRTEIGRSLALNPLFLLLDEPFTGIDPLAIEDIQELLKTLAGQGIGILITDHNVRETLKICDFAYVMQDGRMQVEGTSAEIVANPLARRYYLGEHFTV